MHEKRVEEMFQQQEERLTKGYTAALAAAMSKLAPVGNKQVKSATLLDGIQRNITMQVPAGPHCHCCKSVCLG